MAIVNEYILAVFCCIVGIALWENFKAKRKYRLPPGPLALPILGNVLQIGTKPHLRFTQWAKTYGPIFKIKMGTKDTLVISDHKLMKELFSDYASTGRMLDNPQVFEFSKGPNGVINSEGSTWEAQRRFTLRTLRDFGFAKTSMEGMLADEVSAMLDWFRKSKGVPLVGNRMFNAPVLNTLWRMVAGERCEWEKSRPKVFDVAEEFMKASAKLTTNGFFFAPVLRFIIPELIGWNHYLKTVDNMFSLIQESIEKHKKTFDPENIRDFIDQHLLEAKNTTDPKSSFYKEAGNKNMVTGVFDLFMAGSETTSNTLSWVLLYLGHHQNIQKKLQMEIDQVLGSSSPTLSAKTAMPHTNAIILEILRITSLVALGVPHRMIADVKFHGYDLPKGISIFPNQYAMHHDVDIWGDPETFRPDRFLNEDGTLVVGQEGLAPFGDGRRHCIGEKLAMDTLFMFVTGIFQEFNVSLSGSMATFVDFEPELGYLLIPKPFEVKLLSRS